jgi:hypothetical protein
MARYVTDITLFGQIEVEAASQEEARAHFRRVMGLSPTIRSRSWAPSRPSA